MKLESISKKFGDSEVLVNVSALFDAGKIYILAGPNGAGKTTLLRIIAGLLKPTSGHILFETNDQRLPANAVVAGPTTDDPVVGVMMQESFLYVDLSPRENLELYAGLYGLTKNRIGEVSAILKGFIDHDVATLSHGQRQRTSLARALLPNPQILLLDEPFLGLDAATIEHVRQFLVNYRQNGGLAIIATHEIEIVRGIADVLMLLEEGQTKYFGSFRQ